MRHPCVTERRVRWHSETDLRVREIPPWDQGNGGISRWGQKVLHIEKVSKRSSLPKFWIDCAKTSCNTTHTFMLFQCSWSMCTCACMYMCVCVCVCVCVLTFKSLLVTWCTNSLTFNNCTLCPHCIYVFCIYLRTNSDLCHLQHKLIGFYNRDEKCLLRGMDRVFK